MEVKLVYWVQFVGVSRIRYKHSPLNGTTLDMKKRKNFRITDPPIYIPMYKKSVRCGPLCTKCLAKVNKWVRYSACTEAILSLVKKRPKSALIRLQRAHVVETAKNK